MLKHYLATLAFVASNLFSVFAYADTEDYDCAFEIAKGNQSIRSLTLTDAVYRCFQFSNYADLAIVNADQQLVPFTLSSAAAENKRQEYQKDIAFFSEPEESSYRTGEQIRRIAALTGLVSRDIDAKQWQSTNVHYSSFILEQASNSNAKQSHKLKSVSLDVDTQTAAIRATVLIEASDDLQNWKTVSKPHNLFFLQGDTQALKQNQLTLSGYSKKAKYLRLATLSNVESFADRLRGVSGKYVYTERITPELQWLTVKPYEVENNVWQFDLPLLAPFEAIKLSNAQNIVYYQGNILSKQHLNPNKHDNDERKSGKKKIKSVLKNVAQGKSRFAEINAHWRTVRYFKRYKLIVDNGSLESADIEFSNVRSRSWRIKFNEPANITADQLPKIEIAWAPSQVNFIAQGRGPFVLKAGRETATKKIVFPSQLKTLNASTEQVALVGAVENAVPVSEPALVQSQNEFSWSKVLLWSLLLFGVGLMLYMAYRLMRSMNQE